MKNTIDYLIIQTPDDEDKIIILLMYTDNSTFLLLKG